jgi:hypothetical protein
MAEGNDPEAVRKRAMADPEVTQILKDPAMQMILQQMEKDPKAVSYGLLDILQKAFQCDYRIFTLTNAINKSLPSDR